MAIIILFGSKQHVRSGLAIAGIAAGVVVASAQTARAQGLGQMLGIGAVGDLIDLGIIPSWLLYMMAAVLFIVFVAALSAKHKANHQMGWGLVAIPFIASVLCAVAPTLITAGAQTATGQAPTITNATAVQPMQWQ